ncbi:MAG: FtsX-like permease family protein [Clostridia bacterium]|nr:FtsX-like permease family protein [Clostridia bacterium]
MLRDILENKGAYLACLVIIAMGVMIFTSFASIVQSLHVSQQAYYENQNFADGFVQVTAIPPGTIARLRDIDGIEDIQGRLVKDVTLWQPENPENIYLRLISVDPNEPNPINGVLLSQGRPLQKSAREMWLDNQFFSTHNLSLNDQVEIIAAGKRQRLTVVGVGSSPEFVYALRSMADIYPDPETFGIGFVPWDTLRTFFPDTDSFNELVFTLKPGAGFEQVKEELERQLAPYGLISIISRADQVSHQLLQMDIDAVESMSTAMPVMFLGIAAVILYITLKRLIEQQRGQIGILKAEGYTDPEILRHYLSYALFIGLVGGVAGSLMGSLLAYPLTAIYQEFFNLPAFTAAFSPFHFVGGIVLSVGFALLAGYQGAKKVLSLQPVEAMRPHAPIAGKRIFLEHFSLLWRLLNTQGRMAVRNLTRNQGRSLFIFFGIMICFAISSFTWSMNDIFQKMLYDQYEKVEVYDLKITFAQPLKQDPVLRELRANPGVQQVEPLAEVPVTLKHQWHEEDVVIIGILSDSRLYNILDSDYNRMEPPENGILLSERLAGLLEATVGTTLSLESPLKPDDRENTVVVAGIIPQYVGMNAYMEISSLQRILREPGLATAAMVNMDQEAIPFFKEKYLTAANIAAIEENGLRLNKMKELMDTYGSMIYLYALIGVIVGFAIIYSSSVITIAERERELASMMVLGMTPEEVLSVVTFEQWCIGVPALILGIPVAKGMMGSFGQLLNSDLLTMPTTLSSQALFLALMVTVASIWIAQRTAARKIRGFSLAEVLKSRE